jgi:hypothetical protein
MKERLSRLQQRASKKRQLGLAAMTEVGLSKLEQPDFTASVRAGSPALVVIAEDRIPAAYWLPQPSKLDRQAILGELRRGIEIPGAQMSNPKPRCQSQVLGTEPMERVDGTVALLPGHGIRSHRQRTDCHLCLLLRQNSPEGMHWKGGRSPDASMANHSRFLVHALWALHLERLALRSGIISPFNN